jgi:wobble nucleotide-excising tRNase
MTVLKIDLSHFPDRYAEWDKKFIISKKTNFIFGKNGTGKTTLTDEIKNQYSTDYNVCIFKDFDGVVENSRLNAIALGTENAKIQDEIEIIEKEIVDIKKEVEEPTDETENLFSIAKKRKDEHTEQDNKIAQFYTDSARIIKNQTNPQIAKTSYSKTDFQNEISRAKSLSEDDIEKHKETIKAEKKTTVTPITFPNIDLAACLQSVNEILQASVTQQQVIAELQHNADKQNFAKEGLRIHEHKQGEKCAFCGNEIREERWQLLGNYFNDEVKKLEDRINQGIKKIDAELTNLSIIKEASKTDFYKQFEDKISLLTLQSKSIRNDYKTFLGRLKTALEGKTKNLFTKTNELTLDLPTNFDSIKKDFDKIICENNDFSENIQTEQQKAKAALRYNEIKKALDNFKYDAEKSNLSTLETVKSEAQKKLNAKKTELKQKNKDKNTLILQTKNEKKIAEQINQLLKGMGVSSFSLELVNDTDEQQKGQYQIRGHNGKIRAITELSKGEKNIIAFLYFLFSLNKVSEDTKPKIVILDDPMTSNDDTMQYLMIGEIQKFYNKLENDCFFILLTHNCHFYLNVRPDTRKKYEIKKEDGSKEEISHYKKYGNFHLYTNGENTTIKSIENGKQDFTTNYEMLWKELLFLYNAVDATSDLMLNPCRKICETYMHFTKKGIESFYGKNTNAKKLFDVNQHSIDDLEAEQNGKTKDEIKTILEELFKNNNSEEHFKAYWKS